MPARIVFPRKGEVRLESFEPREPAPGEVRVRTQYSLMNIGTETTILHQRYDLDTHFASMFSFPQLQTGVQSVGVVDQVGDAVEAVRQGETVFMSKAHASHWTLPSTDCSLVPSNIEAKSACWCGLARTAFRAAHAAPFALGGRVLIVGAGPVGQMAVRWAAAAGMQLIAVVDLSSTRLVLARRGGATHCFAGSLEQQRDAVLAASGSDGFEIVVEATGSAAVFAHCLSLARTFGKVVLLGDTGYPARQCLTSDVMRRGLTLIATHVHHERGGLKRPEIDALFFSLAGSGRFPLDSLITHEYTPEFCADAYELVTARREQTVGVLFDWSNAA